MCSCACAYIHAYAFVQTYVWANVCMYTCVQVCMYTHVSMYMVICMHVSVALFMHLCMCVCEHRCAYVCVHTCLYVGGVICQNCQKYTKRDKKCHDRKKWRSFLCLQRRGFSLHFITKMSPYNCVKLSSIFKKKSTNFNQPLAYAFNIPPYDLKLASVHSARINQGRWKEKACLKGLNSCNCKRTLWLKMSRKGLEYFKFVILRPAVSNLLRHSMCMLNAIFS